MITIHAPRFFFTEVLGGQTFCSWTFNLIIFFSEVESFGALQDGSILDIPEESDEEGDETVNNRTLFRNFIYSLQEDRPHAAPLQIIR